MNPAMINIILMAVEALVKDAPQITAELKALFTKADPTVEDWQALRARIVAKSYEDYVPATTLPKAVSK